MRIGDEVVAKIRFTIKEIHEDEDGMYFAGDLRKDGKYVGRIMALPEQCELYV